MHAHNHRRFQVLNHRNSVKTGQGSGEDLFPAVVLCGYVGPLLFLAIVIIDTKIRMFHQIKIVANSNFEFISQGYIERL